MQQEREKAMHKKPRALIMANRISDHYIPPRLTLNGDGDRIHDVLDFLKSANFENYILPVASIMRLSAEEKISFFKSLEGQFELFVGLAGQILPQRIMVKKPELKKVLLATMRLWMPTN